MENDNVVLGVFWVGFFFFPQKIQIAAVFRGVFFKYVFNIVVKYRNLK